MNKFYLLLVLLLVVVATSAGASFYFWNISVPAKQVACTMEAKVCPDGSYVARAGDNCEFAQCPVIEAQGTLQGKVSVGPICPVERVDMPCPVPPEAYTSREIMLYAKDGITVVKRMHFLADGTYSFSVPAGTYILNTPKQPIGGSSDLPKIINIKPDKVIEYNFSIDTGIR